jgi:hypothetical protein
MFGQGSFPGVVDFGVGAFCPGVGVGVVGVLGVVGVVALVVVLGLVVGVLAVPVVELGAAAAPAIPEAAPPAASAPATIVAPSIFDICMRFYLLGVGGLCLANHLARRC